MKRDSVIFLVIFFSLLFNSWTLQAEEEWNVDQSDSLNFQDFHKDKDAAIKLWKSDKNTRVEKPYEQSLPQPKDNAGASAEDKLIGTPATDLGATAAAVPSTNLDNSGKRYEIRERYTLNNSANTPYSAFFVIQALHQQMAGLCAKGWKKLAERSEPIETDYYLYYLIECL